jgi:hypothetical protein
VSHSQHQHSLPSPSARPNLSVEGHSLVNTNTTREAQLAEYEANNASYLHYDSFRWSAGSFLIAGVFLFCGSLLSGGSSQLFAPATGLVICVMTGWIYYAHRSTGVGGQLPASGGTARSVTGACPTRSRADRRLSPRCVLAAASTRACRRSAAVPSSRRYRTRHVGIFGRRDWRTCRTFLVPRITSPRQSRGGWPEPAVNRSWIAAEKPWQAPTA